LFRARPIGIDLVADSTITGTGHERFIEAIILYVFQDPYILLAVYC
jgi:hypothetical protein